jgi:hypothetical protein
MKNISNWVPPRADYSARSRSSGATKYAQIAASLLAAHVQKNLSSRDPLQMLKRNFVVDRNFETVFKTATSPATVASASISPTAFFPDSIALFGGAVACGAVIERCLRLQFDASAAITVPNIIVAGNNAAYFGEGSAIKVVAFDTSNTSLLTLKQVGAISPFTHELFDHSLPNIAPVVGDAISRDIGLAVDGILLGSAAASTIQPAGLRWNLPALTASSTSIKNDAMASDISTLFAAVAPIAGNSEIVIVASPAQFASLKIWRADLAFTVLASNALANGVVIALAVNAFVSVMGVPRFEICNDATLILDSAPRDSVDTTAVATQSVRSLIQSDLVAVKTVLPLNFGLRAAGGCAWVSGTSW